jgi:S-adenosylmethionine-diacylglycerol 3-amino-3-carboxypropyl transferase
LRYAYCWEDADVLLAALRVTQGDRCLSIASAGDNTMALVGAGAHNVLACDLSTAQVGALELRRAAYRRLEYPDLLALLGERDHGHRSRLYSACRSELSRQSRAFWDAHPKLIRAGIGRVGKFERYLSLFRRFVLPLVHSANEIDRLLADSTLRERADFYDQVWNNRRWQWLGRLFFGPTALGRLGRDPSFAQYADETVWESLQRRIPHALVLQVPGKNPYLRWILTGRFGEALPFALREENFEAIRGNLDSLDIRCDSLESVLAGLPDRSVDACNLSDVFEYVSADHYEAALRELVRAGRPGCRVVYWNLVTRRRRPESLAPLIREQRDLATRLHHLDKAFFYRDLVVEEVI